MTSNSSSAPAASANTTGSADPQVAPSSAESSPDNPDSFFTRSPDLAAVLTADGLFVRLNPAWREHFAGDPKERIGSKLADLVHPDDAVAFASALGTVIASGNASGASPPTRELRSRLRRTDGSYRKIVWSCWPEATTRQLNLVGHDVTDLAERRESEEQVSEQAALLDKATDAIMVIDLDDQIVLWYAGAERLYGYLRGQVIGQRSGPLLGTPEHLLAEAREVLLARGEWSGELTQSRRDGAEVVVEARWSLVRDNLGRPRSILAIHSDVTAKRRLEAQYMRAQRLESIGTMAGGIAHDLNNVLAPILMSISLLRERVREPAALRLLGPLEESATRGAAIVRQVLSFARGLDGSRVTVLPAALLEDVSSIIRQTFPRSIRITSQYPQELWPIVGDLTQLQQVLLNLCVNARDAMVNGGELTLAAENVHIDEHYSRLQPGAHPGNFVLLRITDSGSGIPPEIRDKVFDPFFTTKPPGQGTGLGLPTAASIVNKHSGFLELHSEVGSGTRVEVYLPAVTAGSEPAPREHSGEVLRGHDELLLLVDDESAVLSVTAQTLEACGYRVITATNGAEAIAKFAERPKAFAAVITDLMMPVMDGAATIQALRALSPEVRVIATSGMVSGVGSLRAQHLDVAATLAKPYTAETLLTTLRGVLSGTDRSSP